MHKISSWNFHTIMQSYHRPQNNHKIIIFISDFVVPKPLFQLDPILGYYTLRAKGFEPKSSHMPTHVTATRPSNHLYHKSNTLNFKAHLLASRFIEKKNQNILQEPRLEPWTPCFLYGVTSLSPKWRHLATTPHSFLCHLLPLYS